MNEINKAKEYKTKNIAKKNNFYFFQEKIPLDNINHKTNNNISVKESESVKEKKNNAFSLRDKALSQNKMKLFKKGKDIKIFITNRNNSPIFTFNKGLKSNSQYNIFSTPNINLLNNNGNNFNKLNFSKVQKSGEESIIKNSKNIHILNNIYQNNNFNLLNNSHSLNNNNTLNKRIVSEHTPKKKDILEYNPVTTRKVPDDHIIFNNVRLNNKSNYKRYSMFNNTTKDNKRSISDFKDKVINRKNINKKDNLAAMNYDSFEKIKNNHIMNKPQTQTKNANNTNYLINQINNININFNNNENINKQLNRQANSSSIESIINQLNNKNYYGQTEDIRFNTDLKNNNNYFQTINKEDNNSLRSIIKNLFNSKSDKCINNSNLNLSKQIDSLNNHEYNNQLNNTTPYQGNQNILRNINLHDYFNNINNNQNNKEQNFGLSEFYKSIIQKSSNNIINENPYNQFLENKKNGNNLLKDFGALSRAGNDEGGLTKINQDSYISKTNINGITDFNIFGVLDGHGIQGHLISDFASKFLPNQIINNFEIKLCKDTESIYNKLKEYDYQIIKQAYISTDNNLKSYNLDGKESGTTCNLIIHVGEHLICSNVGDSKAIIVFDEENDPNLNFLNVIPLSNDHKPEFYGEKERILMYGGVIRQIKDKFGQDVGPYRVYARGKDYPGIAMSRSIGDYDGKKIGIIAEPDINEYFLGSNTKFFILCSDGVSEFMNNDMIKEVGKQFYLNSNARELCQELISRSIIEWKTHETMVDDITAIAGFF